MIYCVLGFCICPSVHSFLHDDCELWMGQVPCGAKQGYGSDTLASALRVCTSAGKVTTESDSVETGCTTTYTAGLGEG